MMDLSILAAETGGSALIAQEFAYVVLLVIAALVALVQRRIRLPYTILLVLVGLAMSFLPPDTLALDISSELILALLVPPLIFEAAFNLPWYKLRRNVFPVLLLALVGTLIGTFLVAGAVTAIFGFPLAATLAFGALISATDPVAVIAFFRTLGVEKRLAVLVEGESLFNDGIAIVVFNLAVATGALMNSGEFEGLVIGEILGEFAVVAGGGLLLGAAIGGLVSWGILANVDDHLIETAVTLAAAYGSFVIAEYFGQLFNLGELHFSGILSVVAASLFVGNIGRIRTSPTTKIALDSFWEFLAFVMNSFVFLIIGLRIDITQFITYGGHLAVAVGLVLISRALVVYTLSWLHARLERGRAIPLAYRHVMYWGGLRGAISLALVIGLDGSVFGPAVAEPLRVMTFGVVLFTLLVQGMSMEPLIRRLRLAQHTPEDDARQRYQAEVFARFAGRAALDAQWQQRVITRDIYDAMLEVYKTDIEEAQAELQRHLRQYPELEREMVLQARETLLSAERSALSDALRRGLITDDVHEHLVEEANARITALSHIRENRNL